MGKHGQRGGSSRGHQRRSLGPAVDDNSTMAAAQNASPPLKQVMTMNGEAMAALQRGDMDGSYNTLIDALEIVQQGLSDATVAMKFAEPDMLEEEKNRKEAWLLALSVTVSNLGCQLRKANKSEEALTFLYKAKDAETILYGKPSTSTMLNISAILLGRGDLKEALDISRDCVNASAEGDKMLHITALHNLAMSLAQQPEAADREEALNTMQRGLAEAEQYLGISHPTTALIRDRCLHPDRWIADDAYVQRVLEARRHGALSDVLPKLPPPPTTQEPPRTPLPPSEAAEATERKSADATGVAALEGILQDKRHDGDEEAANENSGSAGKSGKRVSLVRSSPDHKSGGGKRRRSSADAKKQERENESGNTPDKKTKASSGKKKNSPSILLSSSSPRGGSGGGRAGNKKASPPKKGGKKKRTKAEPAPEPRVLSEELQRRAKKALESLEITPTPYPPDRRVPRTVPNRNLPAMTEPPVLPGDQEVNPVPPLPSISPDQPPHPIQLQDPTQHDYPSQQQQHQQQHQGYQPPAWPPSKLAPSTPSGLPPYPMPHGKDGNGQPPYGPRHAPPQQQPQPPYPQGPGGVFHRPATHPSSSAAGGPPSPPYPYPTQNNNGYTSPNLGPYNASIHSVHRAMGPTHNIEDFAPASSTNLPIVCGELIGAEQAGPSPIICTSKAMPYQQQQQQQPPSRTSSSPLEHPFSRDGPPSADGQGSSHPTSQHSPSPNTAGSDGKPMKMSLSSELIESDKIQPEESLPVSARLARSNKPRPQYGLTQENGSFLRFAAVEDSADPQPFSAVTYKHLREKIRREATLEGPKPAKKRAMPVKRTPSPQSAHSVPEDEVDPITNSELSTFKKLDLQAKRQEAIEKQKKEEEKFKVQRLKREVEKEKERKFKEGLAAIQARTENRAATVIQQMWRHWWRHVGKPRREAQEQRAAERLKRVHQRMVNDTIRRHAELKGDWTLSGLPPPIVVVNCKNKWMEKTVCLRYLARKHIYHRSRTEGDILRLLVRAQACVRGMLARKRYQRTKTVRAALLRETVPHEEREYAALVIQKMFRCHRARRQMAEAHKNHYEPAAIIIQEWYRMVIFDQRARGVDTRSVQRRLNAVVLIQKTWRGYLGRVKYYMQMLRHNMDQCSIAEKRGCRLLQRVCRGYMQRRWLGNYAIDACMQRMQREREETEAALRREKELREAEEQRQRNPVIPRTEYEKQCLERADEVYRQQQKDREEYYVPLYLEPEAKRQRQAWKQAIRTRPLDVRRRRAAEDLLCQMEHNTNRRERAAIKIQREFRAWLRLRDSKDRDTDYLTICKGVYHQREYERIIQEKQYKRHQDKGVAIFGDVAAPQRECVEEVRSALKAELEASPDFVPASAIRTRAERLATEKRLQHDEEVVAATYHKDMKRLREDPIDVKNRTGAMYQNPTLRGLPTEGFQTLYDLD